VVDQQQGRAPLGRGVDGRLTGVHRSEDSVGTSRVLYLQAIESAWIVRRFAHAQVDIEVPREFVEGVPHFRFSSAAEGSA
jgi:hypothetical protein